jgi:hypothetical protein
MCGISTYTSLDHIRLNWGLGYSLLGSGIAYLRVMYFKTVVSEGDFAKKTFFRLLHQSPAVRNVLMRAVRVKHGTHKSS